MDGKYIFNYPIETEEAEAFWDSEHKCNTAKAFVAFSTSVENCNEIMKRHKYSYQWRKRVLSNFAPYLASPSMVGIPFSQMGPNSWWDCMQHSENIDLEWLITEITEETICTEDWRPILTENSLTGPNGPELPLPGPAWLATELTGEDLITEDGILLIYENLITSEPAP